MTGRPGRRAGLGPGSPPRLGRGALGLLAPAGALALFLLLGLPPPGAAAGPLDPYWRRAEKPGAPEIRLVAEALSWLGTPYAFGGEGRGGVDCSGFVRAVLAKEYPEAGLPRKSEEFLAYGQPEQGAPRPGDILLFSSGGAVKHVGIALSELYFIHAASDGPRTGVIISSLEEAYWKRSFAGARRPEERGK